MFIINSELFNMLKLVNDRNIKSLVNDPDIKLSHLFNEKINSISSLVSRMGVLN